MAKEDMTAFGRVMGEVSVSITVNTGKKARATALEISRRLILATPVDTGQARTNWLVGINRPRKGIERPPISAAAAIVQAAASIVSARDGADIWISNNLDYIEELNRGKSAQAPAGYVNAIVRTVGRAGRIRLLDKK